MLVLLVRLRVLVFLFEVDVILTVHRNRDELGVDLKLDPVCTLDDGLRPVSCISEDPG